MSTPLALLLVLQYDDHLEPCASESDAIAFIRRFLPLLPDKAWDEEAGGDGEHITEYEVEVQNGRVKLLALA
jgi:hypothetical protein